MCLSKGQPSRWQAHWHPPLNWHGHCRRKRNTYGHCGQNPRYPWTKTKWTKLLLVEVGKARCLRVVKTRCCCLSIEVCCVARPRHAAPVVTSRLVSSRLVVSVRKMSGDAASAQPTGSAKTPNDFLKSIKGRPVVVKLNSGVDYRGMPGLLILVSVFSPSFLHDCRCWFLASGFARSSPINFFFFCCWI